jgi:hypothetical protein
MWFGLSCCHWWRRNKRWVVGAPGDVRGSRLLGRARVVNAGCKNVRANGVWVKAAPLQEGCRPHRPRTCPPCFSEGGSEAALHCRATSHFSRLTSHAPVASTALRSAFNSPGVNSIAPALALAIACSPLRAPTRACVQPGCETVQAITT